ncbi:hypothetical protein C6361_11595 [Plantactinospora sp. BC1]|uniref:hypothetical protein n=1 Tax=Plantactinospora sp. BC1 TaxID=2108470 RepID=UPI000D15CC21|nr:hypothetical protein [Plantactinospora sp. BC1]AVT30032.1 hypothetical protein C6361_11595 [Plantactinospora sp. BC1]
MGDFEYYDSNILRVAGDAIREEAAKWDKMSGDMANVAGATKQLWLTPVAFAVADPWAGPAVAIDDFAIYNDVHKLLCSLLDGAATEFGQLGDALRTMAGEYEKSDERSYINISKIYKAE